MFKIKADRLASLQDLRGRLHPLCKHLYWRSEGDRPISTSLSNEEDSTEPDSDKEAPPPLHTKITEEELLIQGKFISPMFFDDISSGLTQELLRSHEEMIVAATAQLVRDILRAILV